MAQSNPNLYQPLMNQAHLSIGERKYETAINLYENILERFLPGDLKTQMYLSKAYYRKGDFSTCKKITLNLLAKHPNCVPLKFNLALCLSNLADNIMSSEIRRAHQTMEAIKYLKQSQKLFVWVQNNFKGQFKFIRSTDLSKRQ